MKFEANIILFLQKMFNSSFSINFFKITTHLGDYIGIIIMFISLFFICKKLSYYYLISSLIGVVGNYILKFIIHRPRPYVSYPQIKNYLKAVGYSMPSSHTIVIVIIFIFTLYISKKYLNNKSLKTIISILISLLTLIVLISRMVLGQHYLTDIIVGLIIGVVISMFTIKLFEKNKKTT